MLTAGIKSTYMHVHQFENENRFFFSDSKNIVSDSKKKKKPHTIQKDIKQKYEVT